MALTKDEKIKRKERARRRREAKAAGTYTPRKERRRKVRKELETAVSVRVSKPVDREQSKRLLRKQKATQQDRIGKHTGWRPLFNEGESK